MKAKMVRNLETRQFYIEAKYPNGNKCELWEGIIEHCAKDLSANELRTIYADCNRWLLATDPNNVPLKFREMMRELQQTIINRKAWVKQ